MTPLRSVLFVPGSNLRAIEKAKGLPCDVVIIDLEDAVGPEEKASARQVVSQVVPAGGFAAPLLAVRVNGDDTAWATDDLAMLAKAKPAAVLIPKVGSVGALRRARDGLPGHVRLWANIETCVGVLEAREITAGAAEVGLDALVFGENDLSRD
jgi:citrate lyase subunit beta/citryl-CoA lyase